MRRPFPFGMAILIPLSVLLSTFFAAGLPQAVVALNSATVTPFPLPTQVISLSPAIIELRGDRAVELRPFELGEPVAETDHFRFYARQGHLPVDLEHFMLEAEEVFDYVSNRLGVTLDTKMLVLFEPPDTGFCPNRGIAMSPSIESTLPIITIFADERTSHAQVLGVLAHEVGHVLQEIGHERDWAAYYLGFNEGLATWAAGKYWYAWQGDSSFDALVRSYLEDSIYMPLYANFDLSLAYSGGDCTEKRDILYTEWASFIDFLLSTYGIDRLQTLLRSSPPEEIEGDNGTVIIWRPPDFESVYGRSLNQLEAAWLDHLRFRSVTNLPASGNACSRGRVSLNSELCSATVR